MSIGDSVAELGDKGFCVLRAHYAKSLVDACREAFWPILSEYLDTHYDAPNRGPSRHFLPMPFEPPCFAPEFFFDSEVLAIVRGAMDERVVADQWGCDVPLKGSENQEIHIDYKRPLFPETPDLSVPTYMLVVSFSLIDITLAHGPIEVAAGTHRMPRNDAVLAVERGRIKLQPVTLNVGDVLIRHPWALHRGTPNTTDTARALLSIRYVRRWYADYSREVSSIPQATWQSLAPAERNMMRFPLASS
jgi:ectoine hydroxylase-related dioxygenase (phytanoyl-CoA dioxygenase family)